VATIGRRSATTCPSHRVSRTSDQIAASQYGLRARQDSCRVVRCRTTSRGNPLLPKTDCITRLDSRQLHSACSPWTRSRSARQQGGEPERRIGGMLKAKVLGRRRVTLVVGASGFSSSRAQRDSFASSAGSVCASCCASDLAWQLVIHHRAYRSVVANLLTTVEHRGCSPISEPGLLCQQVLRFRNSSSMCLRSYSRIGSLVTNDPMDAPARK
jgi:hypothetical protein